MRALRQPFPPQHGQKASRQEQVNMDTGKLECTSTGLAPEWGAGRTESCSLQMLQASLSWQGQGHKTDSLVLILTQTWCAFPYISTRQEGLPHPSCHNNLENGWELKNSTLLQLERRQNTEKRGKSQMCCVSSTSRAQGGKGLSCCRQWQQLSLRTPELSNIST